MTLNVLVSIIVELTKFAFNKQRKVESIKLIVSNQEGTKRTGTTGNFSLFFLYYSGIYNFTSRRISRGKWTV